MADAGATVLADEGPVEPDERGGTGRAIEQFGVDRVVPQYEQFYDRILMSDAVAGTDAGMETEAGG
jgi:hypothetical protein